MGHQTKAASNSQTAAHLLESARFDIVLLDLKLEEEKGLDLVPERKRSDLSPSNKPATSGLFPMLRTRLLLNLLPASCVRTAPVPEVLRIGHRPG